MSINEMRYKPDLDFGNTFIKLDFSKSRLIFVAAIFALFFVSICVRLIYVAILERDEYRHGGSFYAPQESFRAEITDRHGNLLATSIPTVSAYAVPVEMLDIKDALDKLAATFKDIDRDLLLRRIKRSRKFVWVKRHLTPAQEQALLGLGIPGIYFIKSERRVYPCKDLCPHIIGFTDVDNNGISGLEKSMDTYLKTHNDKPLALSIDSRIQHVVKLELRKSMEKFHANGAGGVVIDIKTGEVLSMVSLPDFDPNIVTDPFKRENFNLMTNSALEPGSSAKIINTALALQHGGIKTSTQFDARFPIKVGRRTIDDYHGKYSFLTVEEILKYSSNIGSVKMALEVGVDKQKEFFKTLGLLDQMPFELGGMQKPLVPRNWSEVSCMTISFGHGIAFNPLQYAASIAGLLNDGLYITPTLIKRSSGRVFQTKRVVSSDVSKQLSCLLRIDVLEGGNKKAEAPGYLVGGKTGTSEKTENGKYKKNANITSFVGAFPMNDPKILVYVVLDEPQGIQETFGYKTAGWNAAPTVGSIIKKIASFVQICKNTDEEIDWKSLLR